MEPGKLVEPKVWGRGDHGAWNKEPVEGRSLNKGSLVKLEA